MGYSFQLAARDLLYAQTSHKQDNIYHSIFYTRFEALAETSTHSKKKRKVKKEEKNNYNNLKKKKKNIYIYIYVCVYVYLYVSTQVAFLCEGHGTEFADVRLVTGVSCQVDLQCPLLVKRFVAHVTFERALTCNNNSFNLIFINLLIKYCIQHIFINLHWHWK